MSNENIKLNFIHICDYASLGEGGKLNVSGIFENINVKGFPAVHPQMFVVTNIIVKKYGEFKEVIKIIDDEKNDIINPLEFNLKFPSSRQEKQAKLGVIAQLNNIKFEKAGVYKVQIWVNDSQLGETLLNVNVLK